MGGNSWGNRGGPIPRGGGNGGECEGQLFQNLSPNVMGRVLSLNLSPKFVSEFDPGPWALVHGQGLEGSPIGNSNGGALVTRLPQKTQDGRPWKGPPVWLPPQGCSSAVPSCFLWKTLRLSESRGSHIRGPRDHPGETHPGGPEGPQMGPLQGRPLRLFCGSLLTKAPPIAVPFGRAFQLGPNLSLNLSPVCPQIISNYFKISTSGLHQLLPPGHPGALSGPT